MKMAKWFLALSLSFSAAAFADDTQNYNDGWFTSNINVLQGYAAYVTYVPSLNPFTNGGYYDVWKGPTYRSFIWKNLAVVFVDIRPETYTEEFTLQTKDDLQIPFRVHSIISVDEDRVKEMVEKYSVEWYKRSVQESLRTIVRQAVLGYTLKELQDNGNKIQTVIEDRVREQIVSKMPLKLQSIEVGQFLNPKKVADAVEEKLASQQRLAQRDTELEIANKNVEIAKSNASAQKAAETELHKALTPEYLQFLAIEAMREMSKNSNATVVLMPISPNGMPLPINIPQISSGAGSGSVQLPPKN